MIIPITPNKFLSDFLINKSNLKNLVKKLSFWMVQWEFLN